MELCKNLNSTKIELMVSWASAFLKKKELVAYETLLTIMMRCGKKDGPNGALELRSSSNCLKGSFSRSKATANRYINTMIKHNLIIRIPQGFKEKSIFFVVELEAFQKSPKNETQLDHTSYDQDKSINTRARVDFVMDQYNYLRHYNKQPTFNVKGVLYSAEEVRLLMSLISTNDLVSYAEHLPATFNKTYVVTGLFFMALKAKRMTEKDENEALTILLATKEYTIDETKEDYAYDDLIKSGEDKSIIDVILSVILSLRNTALKSVYLGKNKYADAIEIKHILDWMVPEDLIFIAKKLKSNANVYCPTLYIRNLILTLPTNQALEWASDAALNFQTLIQKELDDIKFIHNYTLNTY